MKSARVFVAPSRREGFGIAVLEAIACGLPVVTTTAPDNLAQYIAAKSSRSVICDADAESLADTLKGLLRGGAERASAENSYDSWLEEYTWDATAAEVARALKI
jgi:glycosyltransferase involved in cell wall biosynthesis